MANVIKKLFKKTSVDKPITYDEAKKLARHKDPKVRATLAARQDVKPEILYYLVDDVSPEVRRTVAVNTEAPLQADLVLAHDHDDEVRTGLAERIARLAPELSADEQNNVRRLTFEVLEILARDQLTRVRRILSEALKDVAHAPPEVINRLARDAELVVSGPILEHSPLLSDEDIIDIIVNDPINGVLAAISRRCRVSEPVCDAIVDAGDEDDIAVLLANHSAQIREQTLDHIIDRAVDVERWHMPLIKRPKLPAKASVRLARFVADDLLKIFSKREDLDPAVMDKVKTIVRKRLEEEPGKHVKGNKKKKSRKARKKKELNSIDVFNEAKRMHEAGLLGLVTIEDSLLNEDKEFVTAALAVMAGLSIEVVEKAVSTQSAKGLVSIAWKSGLPMETAVQLQKKLAALPAKSVLFERTGGAYPLSEEEMRWQLEFLGDI